MSSQGLLESLCRFIRAKQGEKVESILLKNPNMLKEAPKYKNIVRSWSRQKPSCQPLWDAMLNGHEEIVELLIDYGANPNEAYILEDKKKFSDLTFLQGLAKQGVFWVCYQNVAEVLIRRGADVNFECLGETAFEIAMSEGNKEYAEFLLRNGACEQGEIQDFYYEPKINEKEMLEPLIEYDQLDSNIRGNHEGSYNLIHPIIQQFY